VRANRKALRLAEHGEPFTSRPRKMALRPEVVVALRHALDELRGERSGDARRGARDVVLARRREGRPPLWLRAVPCSPREASTLDGQPGWFWVLIDDPDDVPRPSVEALSTMLGLTHAEARLCALLVGGLRLEQAAAELGIAHETARTHLKATFRKTGARSQADLVRMVLQRPLLLQRGS
jgi:DNA-binding CsgD family transcriptional regulator